MPMIEKVSVISNIGKFSSFNQEEDFQCRENNKQKCNIIFGFNGSGKTILSNVISLFEDNLFINEDQKRKIYDSIKNSNKDSSAELRFQGGTKIKYSFENPHNKEIYVFNFNFVVEHVFDGSMGRMKKFSRSVGRITNEKINSINKKIEDLNEKKEHLSKENNRIYEEYKSKIQHQNKIFQRTLTDKNKRLTPKSPDKLPELSTSNRHNQSTRIRF